MFPASDEIRASVISTLESVIGYPYLTYEFNVVLGVVFAVLFIIGRVICSLLGGNSRGFILAGVAIFLPLAVALFVYAISPTLLNEWVPEKYLWEYTPIVISGAFGMLTLIIITPFVLGVGLIRAVLICLITIALAIAAVYVTKNMTNLLDATNQKIKKNNDHYQQFFKS